MQIRLHRKRPVPWSLRRQTIRHAWAVPLWAFEWFWEWVAYILSNWSFLEVLEYLGSFSILIAVIFYFSESGDRLKQKHFLQSIHLQGARLVRSNFSGADLRDSDFAFADFSDANLRSVNFRQSNLHNAHFQHVHLDYADLWGADLSGADLSGAEIDSVDLRFANLANVHWHDLRTVKNANIYGVKNAPDGFISWALQHGAVQSESDSQ